MGCPALQRLIDKRDLEQQQVIFFHPANKSVHMLSQRKSSEYIEKHRERGRELATDIGLHKSVCEVCKSEAAQQ